MLVRLITSLFLVATITPNAFAYTQSIVWPKGEKYQAKVSGSILLVNVVSGKIK